MTSVLVETSTAIAAALTAHSFAFGDFTAEWDYEHREQDANPAELSKGMDPNKLYVRVIVPRKVDEAIRFTRSNMRYTAAYDIDIRFKFGVKAQLSCSPEISKDILADLSALVEDAHQFFFDNPVLGDDADLQWVARDDEIRVESQILVPYSSRALRTERLFYAVCREYFYKVR